MKKNRMFLWILVAVLLIGLVCVCCFWDSIRIYIMPKAVVTDALLDAYSLLEKRVQEDPLTMLAGYVDPEGEQTADIQLEVSDPLLGNVRYDMRLGVRPHSLFCEGTIGKEQKELNLSAYLDREYMAVSSADLVSGNFYGITYDTFSRDIRSIPLLSWMIGENILNTWNDSVQNIQEKMEKWYSLPEIPSINSTDLKKLMIVLAAIPADVEKTSVVVQGQTEECHRISGSISGPQVMQVIKQLTQSQNAEDASVAAAFYIQDQTLLLADILVRAGDIQLAIQLEMGAGLPGMPIEMRGSYKAEEAIKQFDISSCQSTDQKNVNVQWKLQTSDTDSIAFAYDWNPNTGNMVLTVRDIPVELCLEEQQGGLMVRSKDFSQLYNVFTQKDTADGSKTISGNILIRKGAEFTAPAYKNLDQWSMEDFWNLLEGIGSYIGLGVV